MDLEIKEYNNEEQYVPFKEKQLELAKMLDEASDLISELNMTNFKENLKVLSAKVHNDSFKILVVGSFKNGKSTFINSFLGEAVLPAYTLPTTAIINEIKYGDEKKAILHFLDPLPKKLFSKIPETVKMHMQAHNMQHIPPIEIPINEIEDYVTIHHEYANDAENALSDESPYEKLELFWPLSILKNGVELIDSPGLNENPLRTEVTMSYLPKVDAILFVLRGDQFFSLRENEFIEDNLIEQGFTDPFFIVNRWDEVPQAERANFYKYANLKLSPYSDKEIFYVSAKNALEGKQNGELEKYRASGMEAFEKHLSLFLVNEKGKAKLAQPSKELRRILNNEALFKIIPSQLEMLNTSLDDVKERYEKAKPTLNNLEIKKNNLKADIACRIERSTSDIKRAAKANIRELSDSIPVWINEAPAKTKLPIIPTKSATKKVIAEISEYVKEKIKEKQNNWKNNVFIPLVEEKAMDIFNREEETLKGIFDDIDDINVTLTGNEEYRAKEVPVWQRVVGAAGGLLLGDLGLAASAGLNGIGKSLAMTAAFEFGAGFILAILGLLNPVTIFMVLLAAFLGNFYNAQKNAMRSIKDAMSQEIVNELAKKSDSSCDKIAQSTAKKLYEISDAIVGAVENEINSTKEMIDSIISEMEKGRDNVDRRKAVLKECESGIKELSTRLDDFIFELVG